MQAVISAHCKKFTGSSAYAASFIRCGSDSLDITSQATSSLGFKSVSLCKQLLQSGKKSCHGKSRKGVIQVLRNADGGGGGV